MILRIVFLGAIMLFPSILNNAEAVITTETLSPTDSTYNNQSPPFDGTVHNDDGLLVVESATNFGGHDTRKIWLKFDLPVTQVTSATLSLYAISGETLPTSTDVYFHNDNNWSEATLTFNNEPAHFAGLTSGPHATNTVSAVNQYYDFDVTNLINTVGSTTVTMVFANTLIEIDNSIRFTDETTNTPPLLVIEYEQQVIGGEIIPIESTSLILAGAQSPAVWMISTFSVLGIGAFLVMRNPYNVRNIKVVLQDYLDRL